MLLGENSMPKWVANKQVAGGRSLTECSAWPQLDGRLVHMVLHHWR